MLNDESHLPVVEQSLVFRLRKRAEIRRQIPGRLAVIEGKPDRIAGLLDEAADQIVKLEQTVATLMAQRQNKLQEEPMEHVCLICGHQHDEIREGQWDELPEDFVCPECDSDKDQYTEI